MLVEQLRVQERQLHGVADRIDLSLEPADVLVADVGDLLEDELLDLLLGELLERDTGAHVEQQRVARADVLPAQGRGQDRDELLLAPADHDDAVVVETVLHLEHLALAVGLEDLHDVQRLVQDHLGPLHERGRVDLGRDAHAHLASAGEHVDRAVVVRSQEHAEGRGRLGELLDLFAERLDTLLLGT